MSEKITRKTKFRQFFHKKQEDVTKPKEIRGAKFAGIYRQDRTRDDGGPLLEYMQFPYQWEQKEKWRHLVNDLAHRQDMEWIVTYHYEQNGKWTNCVIDTIVPADSVAPTVNAPLPPQAPRGLAKPPQPVHSQQFRTPEQSMVSDLCSAYLQSGLAEANTETLDLIAEWAHEYIEGNRPFQMVDTGQVAQTSPVPGVDPVGTDPGGQGFTGEYDVPF